MVNCRVRNIHVWKEYKAKKMENHHEETAELPPPNISSIKNKQRRQELYRKMKIEKKKVSSLAYKVIASPSVYTCIVIM